jgi:hypothetical protein
VTEDNVELVAARQTGNAVEAEVARSLLEDAGIPSVVQGANLQDILGYGRLGSGFNLLAGPVRVLVRKEDAARAAEVLAVMDQPGEAPRWWAEDALAGGEAEAGPEGEAGGGEGREGPGGAEGGA